MSNVAADCSQGEHSEPARDAMIRDATTESCEPALADPAERAGGVASVLMAPRTRHRAQVASSASPAKHA